MATNNLDEQFGKTLRDLQAPYDPASWELLSQRLDALDAAGNNTAVDDAAREALRGLEAPFDSAHWQRMEARLEASRGLVLRLRGAKSVEAVLLVLLLLQFGLWQSEKTFDAPHTPLPAPTLQLPRTPSPNSGEPIARQTSPLHRSDAGLSTPGADDPNAHNTFGEANLATVPSAQTSLLVVSKSTNPAVAGVSPAEVLSAPPAGVRTGLDAMDYLAGIYPTELVYDPHFGAPARYCQPVKKAPQPRRWYAALFAGSDRNTIVSTDGDRRQSSGVRTGLALGRRAGRWGLEAGLGYTRKQYAPKREIEIYDGNLTNGYYGSALTAVDADMLSIPVQAHRRLLRVGKLDAYAYAGASAHVALQKDYHYRSVYFPGTTPTPTPLPPQQAPHNRVAGRGVAEKGALSDNVYATADAGLRLEYPLGARYSAYAQAGFQQQIGGNAPGTKQPKINSVGWSVGVLAGL